MSGTSHPYATKLFPAFAKTAKIQVGIAKMNDIATKRPVYLTWGLLNTWLTVVQGNDDTPPIKGNQR